MEVVVYGWHTPSPCFKNIPVDIIGNGSENKDESVEPTQVVIFVYLQVEEEAKYYRRMSLSRSGLKKLVKHVDMHDAAVLDLLGRPDYWSAFGREKDVAGRTSKGFEFFCQHHVGDRNRDMTKGSILHLAPCTFTTIR